MDFIVNNLPVILVFAGTVIIYTLALIQMAILRRREMKVANVVVKMLSFQLDESEKHRTKTDGKLLEASLRLVLCEKANDKLRTEKLKAWNIPDKI
jgi:hypothetical protein